MEEGNSKYDLQNRLVSFCALVIINTKFLIKEFASEHLTKQLIRSATSAALNYGEAQAAESKRDFLHKMKICLKELRESQVNLEILQAAELIKDENKFESVIKESTELVAIFTASIKTATNKI